ncbi:hypothetical protein PVL29_027275 [Vitis rotundifolia]|uniref:ribonuclease P n=1 Tax=Vitis rotundifolia TaxID=103349 RepID=A0AA38YIS7_VITRO|nr:hypothetical protein PVL29_027275 [Vitis rotundifolia]
MEDPEMAFNLKQLKSCGIPPKLRSYGPPLFGFCKKGDADRAYEVDAHMVESGVVAEEPELCALLGLSVEWRQVDWVYEMMHRLRASVRQVSESTAEVENWDVGKVREGVFKGGGCWHGQGWLGKGKWKVVRTEMDEAGVCQSCGEKLVCIDIDPRETENFASSLTKLACPREVKADFVQFQLNSVVNRLHQISPSKRLPLVILHRSCVTGGPAQNPNNEKLIQSWKKSGALYATPVCSNDNWYWLYAAVNCNCLLVTNDEMRDHLLTMTRRGPVLHMPLPYSIVIQHVPTVTGDDLETPRQWLCATRTRKNHRHPQHLE